MYISQLLRFTNACSEVISTVVIKPLPPSSLGRAIVIINSDVFLKFYRRHNGLMEKYNISLRKLLQQGILKSEFYGDLVYRIRKIVGKSNFAEQFRKLINRYKRIGYYPYIMRQTACLVVNPVTVDSYALLFNCTTVVRASMTASSYSSQKVGWGLMLCLWLGPPWFN